MTSENSSTASGSLPPIDPAESSDRHTENGITLRRKKLKDGRWGKWMTRIRWQGKVHVLTLHDKIRESLTVAVRARREIQSGRWEAVKAAVGLRQISVVNLATLRTAYFKAPVEASVTTRNQNWNALEQLISISELPSSNSSSSIINTELAAAWFQAATQKVEAEPDQAKQATLKRSANSRFSQAASVFTARALAYYKLSGIHHAGFDKFLAAGELYQFIRIPRKDYLPPAETIINATFEAWKALNDRNLFLAIGHALAFGLRAGEIIQAKWKWWTQREGYPVLEGDGVFKSGTGHLTVRALDPWFNVMRERIITKTWRTKEEDYILEGHDTQRWDLVYRAASAWLRAQGWETQKTNHALRAYAGSQVAMRYGIYEAQTWLRHSSVLVTEQHYSYFVKAFRPADVTKMAAQWATVAHEFQPVILSQAGSE
jgi:integrase